MPTGRPDWYSNVALSGQYDTTLIPVLVDSDGNMIARLKGIHDSTLKDVLLDSGGRIVSVIRDPTSDQYLAVDAGGNIVAVMKGLEGTNLRPIAVDSGGRIVSVIRDPTSDQYLAVDADGNIVAVMKGDYSGALKTVAVDVNGIMKANLSVQDLDFLTVRPAYGEGKVTSGNKTCNSGAVTTLATISGRGVMLGGNAWWTPLASADDAQVRIDVEGTELINLSPLDLQGMGIEGPQIAPLFLTRREEGPLYAYTVSVNPGLTFETEIAFKIDNQEAFNITCHYHFFYALVP